MKEKDIKELEQYIGNIEQLGADSRYSLDFENWGALYLKLNSIEYWAKKARKIAQNLQEEEENDRD